MLMQQRAAMMIMTVITIKRFPARDELGRCMTSAVMTWSPFVGLVNADGSLVLQIAHPADGCTPAKPFNFGSSCRCHVVPEGWI